MGQRTAAGTGTPGGSRSPLNRRRRRTPRWCSRAERTSTPSSMRRPYQGERRDVLSTEVCLSLHHPSFFHTVSITLPSDRPDHFGSELLLLRRRRSSLACPGHRVPGRTQHPWASRQMRRTLKASQSCVLAFFVRSCLYVKTKKIISQ